MNTATSRLIWKEYRTQRMLWFMVVAGWFLLTVLVRMAGGYLGAGFIVFIAGMFTLASTAIAFAGETEERTALFLRMLPCSTARLMCAKLMAIAAGTVTLILILLSLLQAVEACATSLSNMYPYLAQARTTLERTPAEVRTDFLLIVGLILLVFSAGIFMSMLSGKVLSAVGLTVASCVLSYVGFAGAIVSLYRRSSDTLPVTLLIASAVIFSFSVVFLARPWHLGRLLPSVRFRKSHAIQTGSIARTSRLFGVIHEFWAVWLKRILSRPFKTTRITATLAWREMRSVVLFAVTWTVIGLTLLIFGFSVFVQNHVAMLFFLIAFIHECGQRTMRADQRTGSHLLLANMGVSPLRIWCVKTACWGSTMLVVLGVFTAVAAFMSSGQQKIPGDLDFRLTTLIDYIRVPSASHPQFTTTPEPATSADRWLQTGVCTAFVLWVFAVGQVTACWIRRQILAFGVSLLLIPFGLIALRIVMERDWPVWLAAVPVPLCLLAAAASTSRQWMDRTVSTRLRTQQCAWIVLPVVFFAIVGRTVWLNSPYLTLPHYSSVVQIRTSHFGNTEVDNIHRALSLPASQWDQLDFAEAADLWYGFAWKAQALQLNDEVHGARRLSRNPFRPTPSERPQLFQQLQPGETTAEELSKLLQPFDDYRAKYKSWPALPTLWTTPVAGNIAPALTACLLEDARQLESKGDVPEALQRLTQAIEVNRSLATQVSTWIHWLECFDGERIALSRIRLLLGTADLANVNLDTTIRDLWPELLVRDSNGKMEARFPDPRPMLRRRSDFGLYSVSLASDEKLREAFITAVMARPAIDADDRARAERIAAFREDLNRLGSQGTHRAASTMLYLEGLLDARFRWLEIGGRVSFAEGDTPNIETMAVPQAERVLATSQMGDSIFDLMAVKSDLNQNFVLLQIVETIAAERVTLITCLLHKYRMTHDKFPDNLLTLAGSNSGPAALFMDPFTGGPFSYLNPANLQLVKTEPYADQGLEMVRGPVISSGTLHQMYYRVFDVSSQSSTETPVLLLPPNLVLYLSPSERSDRRLSELGEQITITTDSKLLEPAVPDGDAAGNEH